MEFLGKRLCLYDQVTKSGIESDSCVRLIRDEGRRGRAVAENSFVPRLTMKGYRTTPSFVEICRMSQGQLENVRNFTIENEHGRVQFLDTTNLVGLNLDKIVSVGHKMVEFYPNESEKPRVGQGLNKQALITYYGFGKPVGVEEGKFEKKIRKWTKSIQANFVEYNAQEKFIKIHVKHF